MPGPLNGVRILDCTSVVLGPWAAQQLGDLGADVVKVEPPGGRHHAPARPTQNPGMAAFYLASTATSAHRARSQAGGRARGAASARRGRERALHNYRPQAARTRHVLRGFRERQPGHHLRRTYGFRAAGPYGNKPAYDDIIQAASGLGSLQASIAATPRYMPTIVADKSSSMTVLAAVLAALYHARRAPARGRRSRCRCSRAGRLGHGGAPLRRDVRAPARDDRLQTDL